MTRLTRKKDTLIYKETYKAPGIKIPDETLPKLPHAKGYAVIEAYVLNAGQVERNGERLLFHDMRIYIKETE